MAGEALHVLHGDEAGLFVEQILELAVVQTGQSHGHHQHGTGGGEDGQRLGDTARLAVQGFGRQRHGGAGDGELAVAVAQTVGGQLGPDGFGAHGWMLLG